MPPSEQALRWANVERLRAALDEIAQKITSVGAQLMVVRGLQLALCVAQEPFRWMEDADAVVVRGNLWRVADLLTHDSRYLVSRGSWSVTVADSRTGATIDLHASALPPGFGALSNAALRAHARPARPFRASLLAPDRLDAMVIAIGHFTRDAFRVLGSGHLALDLEVLTCRGGVTPEMLAARLEGYRMRRIGILAFTELASREPRWLPWLAAMGATRMEGVVADAAIAAIELTENHPIVATSVPVLFGDSALDAIVGVANHASRLIRDWSRPRRARLATWFRRTAGRPTPTR